MTAAVDTIAVWRKVDGARVAESLEEARKRLDGFDREVVLDFSAVSRMTPEALATLEGLAATAEEKAVKVTLRAVCVDVYRVLKLAKLTSRFSFIN
jgi:anti-anti-sigma regulatory factor